MELPVDIQRRLFVAISGKCLVELRSKCGRGHTVSLRHNCRYSVFPAELYQQIHSKWLMPSHAGAHAGLDRSHPPPAKYERPRVNGTVEYSCCQYREIAVLIFVKGVYASHSNSSLTCRLQTSILPVSSPSSGNWPKLQIYHDTCLRTPGTVRAAFDCFNLHEERKQSVASVQVSAIVCIDTELHITRLLAWLVPAETAHRAS